MNKLSSALLILCLTTSSGFALAQDAMSMDQGSMGKDAMSKDAMNKDAMGKDAMGKDAMGKDTMKKPMHKKKAMQKDAMNKEAMPMKNTATVCCIAAGEACRLRPMAGRAGRYMSIDRGPNAVSDPSSRINPSGALAAFARPSSGVAS